MNMKMKAIIILIVALAFIGGASFALGQKERSLYSVAFEEGVMGSYAEIYVLYSDRNEREKAEETCKEAILYAKSVEALISANSVKFPTGDIVRFNSARFGEVVEISALTYEIMNTAMEVYLATEGAFNPSVVYLSDFWGLIDEEISNEFDLANPAAHTEIIDEILPLANFSGVEIDCAEGVYTLKKSIRPATVSGKSLELKVELGAIGKGFIADKTRDFIVKAGFERGYVSFGGSSIRLLSPDKKEGFEIGLLNPRAESTADGGGEGFYAKVRCADVSVSSSGDYQKKRVYDGESYCHIIGKDGYPIRNGVAMVTVITEGAAIGDALSTAFSVMGARETFEFLKGKAFANVRVAFVYGDLRVFDGIGLEIVNSRFKKEALSGALA